MNIENLNKNLDKIVSKLTTTRLKDLIKKIRNCKTAADERAVVAKESAAIRTAFKEDNADTRHINVAKLLYIHMLGYPAHFGQIDCLKLVASPKYDHKKLGYLGIMLLLDENQEVLTLVTNCLKNDMNNSNIFIVGIALCTLGNISSAEMARDLCPEVEKLLGNSNSYIRKKAALSALRIIKKVPELLENFVQKAQNLLNERNHGVLLTGVTLLIEMCSISPEMMVEVRKSVPALVRHLKNLTTSGFSPEHDVGGITDPFLQIKLLKLLRILGKSDAEASDAMNDVLAQVATNTDGSKNVGNAILYEAVLTIMDIEADNSLRVMGINILGKFLSNRDNNIRYVALTTLAKTSSVTDASALQRHRSTILECLRDPDISIRRRALDLAFVLINSQNIRILTRELLSFLEVCEGDVKGSVASRICEVAGRYRPNKRWEVDSVIRVLRVAGTYVDQNVVNYFIKLVSTGPADLFTYASRKLFSIIKGEGDAILVQEGLVQVAVWCFGEYGDLLVNTGSSGDAMSSMFGQDDDEPATAGVDTLNPVTEREVVDLFDRLLRGPYATPLVKEYSLNALAKLCARFRDETVIASIKSIVSKYRTNAELELQQRSVEASIVWTLDQDVRMALLERIPVLESAEKEESKKGTGAPVDQSPHRTTASAADLLQVGADSPNKKNDDILSLVFGNNASTTAAAPSKSDNVMDLLGGLGLGGTSTGPGAGAAPSGNNLLNSMLSGSPPKASSSMPADPLAGLFSSTGGAFGLNGMTAPAQAVPQVAVDPLAGLFSASASVTSAPVVTTATCYTAFSKGDFTITMTPQPRSAGTPYVDLQVVFKNIGLMSTISEVLLQVAVPKSLKLTMQSATSNVVQPGGQETQMMRIDNPTMTAIRLRMKISYQINGQAFTEMVEFSSFDSSLWS